MRSRDNVLKNIDWLTILFYLMLVFMGWFNIYAAVYDENHSSIFDMTQQYGKQLMWIGTSCILGILILLTDSKFFTAFSKPIYIATIALLVFVLLFGREVKGAKAWFELGSIRIQPAEFAKFATCLVLANVMSKFNFKMMSLKNLITVGFLLALPAGLILLQNDTGSALVYSTFVFVMYREGLHGSILLLGLIGIVLFVFTLLYSTTLVLSLVLLGTLVTIYYYRQNIQEIYKITIFYCSLLLLFWGIDFIGSFEIDFSLLMLCSYVITTITIMVIVLKQRIRYITLVLLTSWACIGGSLSVDYIFPKLLPHQQDRINLLLGKVSDPMGIGYNVNQSQIAIGSGGVIGKGFLQGTQTKFNFVPEQSTDFIFCTVGEEWGFLGSSIVLILLLTLILRVISLAERQRSAFSRIYGYGVASILFFHMAINIGMTIGVVPVIGIPLPFFSYGGSSLWAFTILLFIFIRLDANRLQVFS
ncbi:MAG: rod shape-determining protein RodA [Marinifilaceae bacterium]